MPSPHVYTKGVEIYSMHFSEEKNLEGIVIFDSV